MDAQVGTPVTIVTVKVDLAKEIKGFIEHIIPIDGVDYGVLMPVDVPVVLVRIGEDGKDDEVFDNWEGMEDALAAADQNLAEHKLTLVRSALTLMTVAGEILPPLGKKVKTLNMMPKKEKITLSCLSFSLSMAACTDFISPWTTSL